MLYVIFCKNAVKSVMKSGYDKETNSSIISSSPILTVTEISFGYKTMISTLCELTIALKNETRDH